jgi:hypothetical protein
MAIILEGPDAAGKTTLGRQLKEQFGMNLIVSGGAPHNEEEVLKYCMMQLDACGKKENVIDRITPISHPIYNPVYVGNRTVTEYLVAMVSHPEVVVVYCRPPTDALMRPEKHVWKDYDTESHKQKVLQGQHRFIQLYDDLMSRIPHVTYDYTALEEDYTVELIAMLAATKFNNYAIKNLQELARGYAIKC